MTNERYQIELGVLQNSTIKPKQYRFMDMTQRSTVWR